jgi:hypothetical protein
MYGRILVGSLLLGLSNEFFFVVPYSRVSEDFGRFVQQIPEWRGDWGFNA